MRNRRGHVRDSTARNRPQHPEGPGGLKRWTSRSRRGRGLAAGLAATLGLLVPLPVHAQSPDAGAISGVVVDSLRGGMLAGAVVALESSSRAAATDPDGSFLIDSVPPGAHRLRLLHPVLDTIGVHVVSPFFNVAAGDTTRFILAVPAAATLVRAKCGTLATVNFAGLFGVVVDGAAEPLEGAEIVVSWIDLQISRDAGIRRIPQQRTAVSGEDGRFRVCRLPVELAGVLIVRHSTDSVGPIPLSFGSSPLLARAVLLSSGHSAVRGVVETSEGTPLSGVRVSLAGAAEAAVTDAAGRFVLESQPAGTRTLVARRIGYHPAEFTVNLSPDRPTDLRIELAAFVPVLAEVVVQRRLDQALERVGFAARQRAGLGRFLGPDDIERSGAIDMVGLLRRFNALRVVTTVEGERILVGRPIGFDTDGCVQYFVDGQPWLGAISPLTYIHPQEVGAVEVYSAAFTPAEFTRALQICETVVIWTRFGLRIR